MNIFNKKKWIWQNDNFPNFTYKDFDLNEIYFKLGQIKILESLISKEDKCILKDEVLYNELRSTFLLEGEEVNNKDLKNAIKDKNKKEEYTSLVKTLIDIKNNKEELNKKSLCKWKTNLSFNNTKESRYRRKEEEIEIISGFKENEKIHYQAPLGKNIDFLMENYFNFLNNQNTENTTKPLIKAIIAPLHFILLQTFNEDNEKISRLIFTNILEKHNILDSSYFELNSKLLKNHLLYNQLIDETFISLTLNISKWIEFHLKLIEEVLDENIIQLSKLRGQSTFWNKHLDISLNIRQKKLISKNLKQVNTKIRVSQYMELTNISRLMANRDLQDLVKKGILCNEGKGRGSFYTLKA